MRRLVETCQSWVTISGTPAEARPPCRRDSSCGRTSGGSEQHRPRSRKCGLPVIPRGYLSSRGRAAPPDCWWTAAASAQVQSQPRSPPPAGDSAMPDSSADRDPLDRLAEEFVARYRAGHRPSLTEYAARLPERADEVRELFPALVEL